MSTFFLHSFNQYLPSTLLHACHYSIKNVQQWTKQNNNKIHEETHGSFLFVMRNKKIVLRLHATDYEKNKSEKE